MIFLIFLMIGSVSAQDDLNGTADNILKDTQYTADVDDDDGTLEVEQNMNIPVEVKVDEAWNLNVYIDRQPSSINGEYDNMTDSQIDIPTTLMADGEEVPLELGKHRIVYEFKFTNTTAVYRPEAYISDNVVHFHFDLLRNNKNPQNAVYRFNSQFNIVQPTEPASTAIDIDDIDITYTDTLFFNLRGISTGKASIYIDDKFFTTFEIDDSPFEEEINTRKLAVGSYNLVCVIETGNLKGEYSVTADNSDSSVNVKYTRLKVIQTPIKYITIINTTLNVRDIPDLNVIQFDAPSSEVAHTRSIPVYFEGEGAANFTVYIDGEKVYDNNVQLSWENPCYISTKDGEGNFFKPGNHDISFEFALDDKYARFNPTASWNDNALTFNFMNSKDSGSFLNDKYVANATLKINNRNTHFVPIDSDAVVTILHTNDINLKIQGLPGMYNLTVFVDDVEIYDEYTGEDEIAIKTFLGRSSIEETNERDIQVGTHKIRFEYKAMFECDVDVEYKNNVLLFDFKPVDSAVKPDGVHYQLNTTLIVKEKPKTVHILKVKNNTYFDDTEFLVKMDLYKPEDDDDWDDDDDEEIPIGTQDVGIIVTKDGKTLYRGDYLMNLYESNQLNCEFENENLPKAGTYTIKIINLADNTYDTAKFEVKKENRAFNRKYTSDDFNVDFTLDFSSCNDDLNDELIIKLANKEKEITAKKSSGNSKKQVLFTDIDPGTYTATFTLRGNDIYNEVTLKSKVTVKKETPKITSKSNGNKLEISIDIPKSKSDAVLLVSAGGIQKKFTVDKNTKHLSVEFNELSSGSHDVDIEFMGNERYTSKTLDDSLYISHHTTQPAEEPAEEKTDNGNGNGGDGNGDGNNTGGTGTGTGNSNAVGNGNGTYNGRMSSNARGFNGDLGSQGSGHDGGAKGYEISKVVKQIDNDYTLWIFLIAAFGLLFISFIYKRREEDEEEY
ncbi:hypothetical protein [Methanobrevibacter sp.]